MMKKHYHALNIEVVEVFCDVLNGSFEAEDDDIDGFRDPVETPAIPFKSINFPSYNL